MSSAIAAFVNDAFPPDSVSTAKQRLLLTDVEGTGSPVGAVVPDFRGQSYFRSSDSTYWKAVGLTNADWKQVTN